ncbi:hypothetical protein EDB83DRAFT_2516284 [Lactarius deliciosus]|nr:hypothetical protein EDB83DRAFT_2516284 [Lactarius deliciosus]
MSAIIGPLFNKYLGKVQVKDGIKQKTGRRKAGASDTLIFSGLFSAIDATFLAISVQDLRLDPQDKPTFYLEKIYQLLADPNGTHILPLPSPLAFFHRNLPSWSIRFGF